MGQGDRGSTAIIVVIGGNILERKMKRIKYIVCFFMLPLVILRLLDELLGTKLIIPMSTRFEYIEYGVERYLVVPVLSFLWGVFWVHKIWHKWC